MGCCLSKAKVANASVREDMPLAKDPLLSGRDNEKLPLNSKQLAKRDSDASDGRQAAKAAANQKGIVKFVPGKDLKSFPVHSAQKGAESKQKTQLDQIMKMKGEYEEFNKNLTDKQAKLRERVPQIISKDVEIRNEGLKKQKEIQDKKLRCGPIGTGIQGFNDTIFNLQESQFKKGDRFVLDEELKTKSKKMKESRLKTEASIHEKELEDLSRASQSHDSINPALTDTIFSSAVDASMLRTAKSEQQTMIREMQNEASEKQKELENSIASTKPLLGISLKDRLLKSLSTRNITNSGIPLLESNVLSSFNYDDSKKVDLDWVLATKAIKPETMPLAGQPKASKSDDFGELPDKPSKLVEHLNKVRTSPQDYSTHLSHNYVDMLDLSSCHAKSLKLYEEGLFGIVEAAGFLQNQQAIGKLTVDASLCVAAHFQAKKQAQERKTFGEDRRSQALQNLRKFATVSDDSEVAFCNASTNFVNFEDIVANLVISDGDLSRSSRLNLTNESFSKVGIGMFQKTSKSPLFCCVILASSKVTGNAGKIDSNLFKQAHAENL